MNLKKIFGFTLAELLIALAILGVIATFTIPKVLQNQQDQKKKAILKEVVASFSNIMDSGRLTGDLQLNFSSYVYNNINAIKICNTDSDSEGCWDSSIQGNASVANSPGLILANGTRIISVNNGQSALQNAKCEDLYVDWNGIEGPNTYLDDQFDVTLSWGTTVADNGSIGGWTWCETQKPGTVILVGGDSIFQ